jgi:basic amino acid/polyamine antiporter, APA family
MAKRKLKKELSLFTATLYGIGIIVGAGIYVLIGQGAGIAGNAVWISFAVAAVIAACTGLSYAELAGMFPKDAAEYVYTKKAFKRENISFLVQWIMIFTIIVSASTVALGFGNYLSYLLGVPALAGAALLIIALSIVNYIGIKESAKFNNISTIVEVAGLLIVIAIGMFFIGNANVDYFQAPAGLSSILAATALIFFAYIGFEELVNLSEETKNASRVIPKALVLSLVISTILYILVALSAVSVIGADALAASHAPMAQVVSTVIPQGGLLLAIIALFATANTALVMLIVVSRMLYGMSGHGMPRVCGIVGKRGTPYFSVFIVMLLSLVFITVSGMKTIALLTDVGLFLVYVAVNASLIRLRYSKSRAKRTFKSPINIGRFPLLAGIGIASSGLMLLHFDPMLIFYEVLVAIIGFAFYTAYIKFGKNQRKRMKIKIGKKKQKSKKGKRGAI